MQKLHIYITFKGDPDVVNSARREELPKSHRLDSRGNYSSLVKKCSAAVPDQSLP